MLLLNTSEREGGEKERQGERKRNRERGWWEGGVERERRTYIEAEGQDKEGLTNTMSTNTPLYHVCLYIR